MNDMISVNSIQERFVIVLIHVLLSVGSMFSYSVIEYEYLFRYFTNVPACTAR